MQHRPIAVALALAAALAVSGCVSCEDSRDVDLTRDLLPGDVAHYQDRARGVGSGSIGACDIGVPLLILPLIASYDDVTADPVETGAPHLHFERLKHVALVLSNSKRVADYDAEGRQLSARGSWSFLLWALNGSSSTRRLDDGSRTSASATNVLWGLLWSTWSDGPRSGGRFLLIPWGDDRN